MVANTTVQGHPTGSPHQQEASGWSIFWALLAIIFNCMLQPSPTGYLWNGDAFEGSLWPHRSSPFICLLDAVADIWMALQRLRKHVPSNTNDDNDTVKPGVLTKLALFFLGVLPQAIKLFSVEGIPATQAVAAVFFISSVVNMLRTLCVKSPDADILTLIESLKPSGMWSRHGLKVTTGFLGWVSHAACMFSLWYAFADRVGFDVSENVANAVDWVTALALFASSLYFIQHILFMLIDIKPPIPRYPLIMILAIANYGCLPDLVGTAGRRSPRGERKRQFTLQLVVSLALGSYVIAYILDYLVQGVHKWHKRSPAPTSNDEHLPTYSGSVPEGRTQPMQQNQADTGPGLVDIGVNGDLELGDLPPQQEADEANVGAEVQIIPNGSTSPSQDENSAMGGEATLNQEGCVISTEELDGSPELSAEEPNASRPSVADVETDSNATGVGTTNIPEQQTPDVEGTPSDTQPATKPSWPWWLFETLLCGIIVPVGVILILALSYSGLSTIGTVADDDVQQRAEEGTLGTTNDQPPQDPVPSRPRQIWNTVKQDVLRISDLAFRFIVKWILLLLGRLLLANMSLFMYTFNWIDWQVTKNHPPEILASAFGLANFATAAVYYLALFDTKGTVAPTWANIFGRNDRKSRTSIRRSPIPLSRQEARSVAVSGCELSCDAHDVEDVISRVPKKLKGMLERKYGVTGYGMYAVTGWAVWKFLLLVALSQLGSAIFFVRWLYGHPGDLQNAFTLSLYLVGLLNLVVVIPDIWTLQK